MLIENFLKNANFEENQRKKHIFQLQQKIKNMENFMEKIINKSI